MILWGCGEACNRAGASRDSAWESADNRNLTEFLGFATNPIKVVSPLRLNREAIAAGWRGIRPTLSVTCRLGRGIGNTIALLVERHKFNPSPLCWFSGKAEDESALVGQFSCACCSQVIESCNRTIMILKVAE